LKEAKEKLKRNLEQFNENIKKVSGKNDELRNDLQNLRSHKLNMDERSKSSPPIELHAKATPPKNTETIVG
jgi:chromosome segregation ATPase